MRADVAVVQLLDAVDRVHMPYEEEAAEEQTVRRTARSMERGRYSWCVVEFLEQQEHGSMAYAVLTQHPSPTLACQVVNSQFTQPDDFNVPCQFWPGVSMRFWFGLAFANAACVIIALIEQHTDIAL